MFAGLLCALLVFFSYGAMFITTMTGFLYPTYGSFKALKSKKEELQQQWLTYWVVYSVTQISLPVISFLPYHYYLTIVFYLWLMHPKTKGAKVIYDGGLRKLFKA